jgi:hypothetical protein
MLSIEKASPLKRPTIESVLDGVGVNEAGCGMEPASSCVVAAR